MPEYEAAREPTRYVLCTCDSRLCLLLVQEEEKRQGKRERYRENVSEIVVAVLCGEKRVVGTDNTLKRVCYI